MREPRPAQEPRAAADPSAAITQPAPGAVKEGEQGEGGRRRRRGRGGRDRGDRAEQGAEPRAPRADRSERRPAVADGSSETQPENMQPLSGAPVFEHDVDGNRTSDADGNRAPMTEHFDDEMPSHTSSPVVNDAETERDAMDERFEEGSAPTRPSPDAGSHHLVDDDSPPPTHFVEIRLPPPVAERAAPSMPDIDETIPNATAAIAVRADPTPPPAASVPTPPPVAAPSPSMHHAPASPIISLELPPDSNLVLVETSHVKPAPLSDETETPRPRRVRPPRVQAVEEPLQLVETAHKDQTPPGA